MSITAEEIKREKDRVWGELLAEFVISPRARAALEKMGLIKVQYAGLDEALAGDDFQRLCAEHQLRRCSCARSARSG